MSLYVCVFYTFLYFFIKIELKYLLVILQIQFSLLFTNASEIDIIHVVI